MGENLFFVAKNRKKSFFFFSTLFVLCVNNSQRFVAFSLTSFSFHKHCSSSLLSARLKAFKMSLDQVEVVTKLLRASRTCNEIVLKDCFKDILENGITSKELNSVDKSGRVSESHGEKCKTSKKFHGY